MIFVASALLSSLVLSAHAQDQAGNIVSGTVTGAPNDNCVIPLGNNASFDTSVVVGYCVEATSSWTYKSTTGQFVFSNSDQCLTVVNGVDLTISFCQNNIADQVFSLQGSEILWGGGDSKCVASSGVGNQLVVATCDSSANQNFTFPVSPTTARFATGTDPNKFCIDTQNNADNDNTPLQLSPCDGLISQQFTATNGTYLVYIDKAITPENGIVISGASLEIDVLRNPPTNQLWAYNYTTSLFTLLNNDGPAMYIGVDASNGSPPRLIVDSNATTFTAEAVPSSTTTE